MEKRQMAYTARCYKCGHVNKNLALDFTGGFFRCEKCGAENMRLRSGETIGCESYPGSEEWFNDGSYKDKSIVRKAYEGEPSEDDRILYFGDWDDESNDHGKTISDGEYFGTDLDLSSEPVAAAAMGMFVGSGKMEIGTMLSDVLADFGIFYGDILFIKPTETAHDGDLISFSLNGKKAIRKLRIKDGVKILESSYVIKGICVKNDDDFRITGVVTNILRGVERGKAVKAFPGDTDISFGESLSHTHPDMAG